MPQTIDRVPLLTRNVFDLIQLSAGVTAGQRCAQFFELVRHREHLQRPSRSRCLVLHHQRRHRGIGLLHGGRQPAGHRRKQLGRHYSGDGHSRRRRGRVRVETQNTPASYQSGGAGVISLVSKSGGDSVPWRRLRCLPAGRAGRERILQQAEPGQQWVTEHAALISPLPGGRLDRRADPAQEALLLWRLRGHAAGAVRRIESLYCADDRRTDRRLLGRCFYHLRPDAARLQDRAECRHAAAVSRKQDHQPSIPSR